MGAAVGLRLRQAHAGDAAGRLLAVPGLHVAVLLTLAAQSTVLLAVFEQPAPTLRAAGQQALALPVLTALVVPVQKNPTQGRVFRNVHARAYAWW